MSLIIYGKNNDISVANNDQYTRDVRKGLYKDVEYDLIDANEEVGCLSMVGF